MSDKLDALVYSDPKAALVQLRALAAIHSADPAFLRNYGSRLLDIGRDLGDPNLIAEGITYTEKVLTLVPAELRAGLEINIASAHQKLHQLAKSTSVFDQVDSDEISLAKALFNELQKREGTFDGPTKKRFFIEFGNCLSDMGRFYEAIRLYEHALEIEPDDPVAVANLALSFREVASIADDLEVLRDASAVFAKALTTSQLDQIGGKGTSERILELKTKLDHALQQHPVIPQKFSVQPKSYQDFCKKGQLFLNFCFHSEACSHHPADTITFAVAAVKDENRLIKWARAMNEIKQQFAVGRLLIFEALLDPAKAQRSDQLTTYLDLNDQSVYGLRSGKLKTAYETTFNLFDKIAFFLNDYLGLGIPESDISFRTIWKDKKRQLRAQVLSCRSVYLRALYELSRELPSVEHFGVFTDARNLLTHRYLVLHAKAGDWKTGADGDEYHAGYKEFFQLSLQLLGLAKAAIIYLIAFVRSVEIQNSSNNFKFVRPVKYSRGDLGPGKAEV